MSPTHTYMPVLHLLGKGWLVNKARASSSVPFRLAPGLSPAPPSSCAAVQEGSDWGGRPGWGLCGPGASMGKGAIVAQLRGLRARKWMWRAEAIDGSPAS